MQKEELTPTITVPDKPIGSPGLAEAACHRFRLQQLFSFPVLLGVLLAAAVVATCISNVQEIASDSSGAARYWIFEGDTWWHLVVGNRILATHSFPTADLYSFTVHNQPWTSSEWLGEAAIAFSNRLGGLAGMAALLILLCAALVVLTYVYACARSGNSKAGFLGCTAVFPLYLVFFSLRPQLFGYIFLLVTVICLEYFRRGKSKAIWLLPVVFALWVNTHGTFVLGIAILALYWVSGLCNLQAGTIRFEAWSPRQRRHLGIVTLLSLSALAVTPYGTELATFPLQMAFSRSVVLRSFEEWQPPDFGGTYGKLFLVMLLVIMVAHVAGWVHSRFEEAGLVLMAVWAACLHTRFILFFALVFAAFLACTIARFVPRYDASKDKYVLNAILIILIVAGCIKFFPRSSELNKVVQHGYPEQAVEYIQQHPSVGPVFDKEFWGGYLIWKLDPQQKVFIDGRAELYEPAGVLLDYLQIMALKGNTQFLLQKYNVRSCLIEPDSPLAVYLAASPGWDRVYSDDLSALFVRRKEIASNAAQTP